MVTPYYVNTGQKVHWQFKAHKKVRKIKECRGSIIELYIDMTTNFQYFVSKFKSSMIKAHHCFRLVSPIIILVFDECWRYFHTNFHRLHIHFYHDFTTHLHTPTY